MKNTITEQFKTYADLFISLDKAFGKVSIVALEISKAFTDLLGANWRNINWKSAKADPAKVANDMGIELSAVQQGVEMKQEFDATLDAAINSSRYYSKHTPKQKQAKRDAAFLNVKRVGPNGWRRKGSGANTTKTTSTKVAKAAKAAKDAKAAAAPVTLATLKGQLIAAQTTCNGLTSGKKYKNEPALTDMAEKIGRMIQTLAAIAAK